MVTLVYKGHHERFVFIQIDVITTQQLAASSSFRRSCTFCRSRKIKCSGEGICSVCRERNQDCIYGKEASKGRPKGSVSKRPTRDLWQDEVDSTSLDIPTSVEPSLSKTASLISRPCSSSDFSSKTPKRTFSGNGEERSVAADLEKMFNEDFKGVDPDEPNAFQTTMATFHRKHSAGPSANRETLVSSRRSTQTNRAMAYDKLLHNMAEEMVEMLSVQFSSLTGYDNEKTDSKFFVESLLDDRTLDMFDFNLTTGLDPLTDLDEIWIIQMIEFWFSAHPLSSIISKTLFLRDYRSKAHDAALLAVILADSSYVHGEPDEGAGARDEVLFRCAVSHLHHRVANTCELSTIQTLMLLGWHELCLSRARRATCYLGYAGRLIARVQSDLTSSPRTGFSQINGIDVGKVETEIIQNIYWLTFSITLWAFMQLNEPFSELLPTNIPSFFPPVDESSSTVIKLDVVSHNISTISKQSKTVRELWPLSHIASTAAHVYALLPRKQSPEDAPRTVSWQTRPLHQLRRLFNLNYDLTVLCRNIRQILMDAVEALDSNIKNALSKALVLSAYHTLAVHMLFPRLEHKDDRVNLTTQVLSEFRLSACWLIDAFSLIDAEPDGDRLMTRMRSSTFADMFALGLDACGKAMDYFYVRSQEGSLIEIELILSTKHDILHCATAMHHIAKSEELLTAKNIRKVKKQLKKVRSCFQPVEGLPNQDSRNSTDTVPSTDSEASSTPATPGTLSFASGTPSTSAIQVENPAQGLLGGDLVSSSSGMWSEGALSFDLLSHQTKISDVIMSDENLSMPTSAVLHRDGIISPSRSNDIRLGANFYEGHPNTAKQVVGPLHSPPGPPHNPPMDGIIATEANLSVDCFSTNLDDMNFLDLGHFANTDILATPRGFHADNAENPFAFPPPAPDTRQPK